MTGDELAHAYLTKAVARRRALAVLLEAGSYSDVVREAQELVELVLKAALRLVGIDPPRWHDVGPVLLEHAGAYPDWFAERLARLAEISRWLRREREFAFYGDVDLIPTHAYSKEQADRALDDAVEVLAAVERLVEERSDG